MNIESTLTDWSCHSDSSEKLNVTSSHFGKMLDKTSPAEKANIARAYWAVLQDFRLLSILTAVVYLLRLFLERFVFTLLGALMGVRGTRPTKKNSKSLINEIRDIPETLEPNPTSVKFCSSAWRFLYYTTIFSYGLYVLWNKPWLWDINKCWRKFGKQKRSTDLKIYYFVSLSYYCSMFIRHTKDRRNKDFWQMLLHHITTIMLLSISWMTGTFRIGSLVILVHDCADIFLEFAKMCKYSGKDKYAVVFFFIFTVVWMYTRLWILPFWIIKHTALDAPKAARIPAYYTVNGFLILLQVLHLYWTYYIFMVIYKLFTTRKISDSRSDDEESDTECDTAHRKTN